MKAKRCPAITFPECFQCMLDKGHKGKHVAVRSSSKANRAALRRGIAKLVGKP